MCDEETEKENVETAKDTDVMYPHLFDLGGLSTLGLFGNFGAKCFGNFFIIKHKLEVDVSERRLQKNHGCFLIGC